MSTCAGRRGSDLRGRFFAIAILLAASTLVPCSAGAAPPTSAAAASASSVASPAASSSSRSADITYEAVKPPEYPLEAMQRGEAGLVLLDVTVDSTGKVLNVVVDSQGTNAAKILQDASITAVKAWIFKPGMKDGLPVGGVVTVPINFGIDPPCSDGYHTSGGAPGGYWCVPTSSAAPKAPLHCVYKLKPRPGKYGAYACLTE